MSFRSTVDCASVFSSKTIFKSFSNTTADAALILACFISETIVGAAFFQSKNKLQFLTVLMFIDPFIKFHYYIDVETLVTLLRRRT